MRWPFRRPQEPDARLPHARPIALLEPIAWPVTADDDVGDVLTPPFACSQCGRTDLPPTGDWSPPVCLECDAAINFDAELAAGYFDEEVDR
jgi:hypothetical protein